MRGFWISLWHLIWRLACIQIGINRHLLTRHGIQRKTRRYLSHTLRTFIFGAAVQQYGVLTIGDGLVSQIPSLLISLSTGVLVTKGGKEADFGPVILKQLFGVPTPAQSAVLS